METSNRFPWAFTSAFIVLFFAASVLAQDTTQEKPPQATGSALPAAAEILDRSIEASGGKVAYEKLKTRVTKASLEMAEMGMKFEMISYENDKNFSYQKLDLGGMGSQESGCDGVMAWEMSAMAGARLLSGVELRNVIRESTFNGVLKWRELFKSVKTLAIETVNGKPAYKVRLQPKDKDAKPRHDYYDVESGLLVRTEATNQSQGGEMKFVTTFTEWKTFDGIKTPVKGILEAGPQKLTMTVQSVEHNKPIPESAMQLPAEIKTLLERRRAKEEKKKEEGEKPTSQPKAGQSPKAGGR